MKKFFLTGVTIWAALFANAQTEQTFQPFKVDLALGYAVPAVSGSKGGALFAVEPKYALNDNITVGLRMEAALTAQGTVVDGQMDQGNVKASASYLATADYFFNTNRFRPFVGAGAGIYSNSSANLDAQTSEDVKSGSKFGFAPRAGFEIGHFRTALEYNFAGKTATVNQNYLGIKLGFFIGGGRYE